MFRIGFGYDTHRLTEGRKLILGGVEIPHKTGLLGHSDADVLLHAICDALLGAAGLRDIGFYFPDTSDEFKNIDSLIGSHCALNGSLFFCKLNYGYVSLFLSLPQAIELCSEVAELDFGSIQLIFVGLANIVDTYVI